MSRKRVSATEAARGFSELLNGVRYRGERFTIVRGGKPVATIGPVEEPARGRILADLPGLLKSLPSLDPEDTTFAADVAAAAAAQPGLPAEPGWE